MSWGTVALEPEVTEWLASLADEEFGQAERSVDLLADEGVHLAEPFSRQLSGKLRELRFYLGRRQIRITYFIATGRRIVLREVSSPRAAHESAARSSAPTTPCVGASSRATPLRRTSDHQAQLG